MTRSEGDHSVFYRHSSAECIYLVVYVDDIVLTGSDHHGISQVKQHLCQHFQTKDLGKLRSFLGIEVAQSNTGIGLCYLNPQERSEFAKIFGLKVLTKVLFYL